MASLNDIEQFLGRKRLAMVGVSHNPADFTRKLYAEFRRRGYDLVPVNPNVDVVDGMRCFPSVDRISPPVDGALLMTSAAVTADVVKDCERAGVRQVWMYRAAGKGGAVNPQAVDFCRSKGMGVVDGACPYMFFPRTGPVHRIHGFCKKVIGTYPK
jgi:predicted CoA-binding protein